ncbi:MAG TPA: flagellar biosynthesis protein FlhB [Dehalococcoidia bacterium]|nr:flagellar biosynthesis protein FlhB [Dehalococcoidia bacterium]
MAEETTKEATPKKREDARKKGQVARSQDLSGVLVLLGAILLLRFFGGGMVAGMSDFMAGSFTRLGDIDLNAHNALGSDEDLMLITIKILLPLLLGLVVFAIGATVLQTGPMFSTQALKPQLSRINPLKGTKRILSRDSLVSLVRQVGKLVIVGAVLALVLQGRLEELSALSFNSPGAGASRFASYVFEIVLYGTGALLFLGLADFFWQRKSHARQLKMSEKEVRDELKQQEGDPHLKGRQRELRRDFFNRMMASVPEATVVVTNPTHVAVALKYDPLENDAPIVIAKGKQLTAQRIKAIAVQNGIPLWEDKPLARTLYAMASVGKPVPADLFQAVAEVLAFIFRVRAGMPAQAPGPHTDLSPTPQLSAEAMEA